MGLLFVISLAFAILPFGVLAVPPDFDFDFTGYSKKTQLLISDCSEDVRTQINQAFGNTPLTICYEEPTVNGNHIACVVDDVVGPSLRFYIFKTDDDSATNNTDRQRMEMKVFQSSPADLKATNGTSFIYAWWFRLYSKIVPSTSFFHIFQIKAVGNVDSTPIMTFSLNVQNQFHMRLLRDENVSSTYYDM